ncbi:MAG: proline iminopeptidase-family hydrolase [Rhodopila sp.]
MWKLGKAANTSLWTADRFVSEVHNVVKALGYDKHHVLGQSWGAALGASYALTEPRGLSGLILSNPYLSTPQWEKDYRRLAKGLPTEMQGALEHADPKSEEFKQASEKFNYRHVWRFRHPLPTAIQKSENKKSDVVYNYMWGYKEAPVTGTLRDFDLIPSLSKITVPTLLLCGRYDEITPETTQEFQRSILNSEIVIFEKSSHQPLWTERRKYLKTVKEFLRRVEKS